MLHNLQALPVFISLRLLYMYVTNKALESWLLGGTHLCLTMAFLHQPTLRLTVYNSAIRNWRPFPANEGADSWFSPVYIMAEPEATSARRLRAYKSTEVLKANMG